MRYFVTIIAVIIVGIFSASAHANEVGFDLFFGNSWHTNKVIRLGGHVINDPQWETRAFDIDETVYYSARLRWGGHELELLHDKVYMGYDTPAVQGFNISDGYNFVFYNFMQKWGRWEGRIGAGPIVVHPEGTINGHEIGYKGGPDWRLGGIGFQAAATYRGELREGLSWIAETKVTSGYVHLLYPAPVDEVYAPVSGTHILLGIGYDL